MNYLGYKMLKSEFDNDKALEIASWCNEVQTATWQDMGEYYECVNCEPYIPTTEVMLSRLDKQYESDRTELKSYYVDFVISGDMESANEVKQELESLEEQYIEDYNKIKGGE